MALRTNVPQKVSISGMALQLVFFGNEKLATGVETTAPLLKSLIDFGHHIEAVVLRTTRIDSNEPIVAVAKKHGIKVIPVNSKEELVEACDGFSSQMAVLAAFGAILPAEVLEAFPFGIINVHPSLLPEYRGSTPIEQALLDAKTETGVSIMKVEEKLDAGPLYWQEHQPIPSTMTKQELYEALVKRASTELPELLGSILSGSTKPYDQTSEPTFTSTLTKNDGLVSFEKQTAISIHNHVRAYSGWPGTTTSLGGKTIQLLETTVLQNPELSPGQWSATKNELFVGCETGTLQIKSLKPHGKKQMSGADFARGYLR